MKDKLSFNLTLDRFKNLKHIIVQQWFVQSSIKSQGLIILTQITFVFFWNNSVGFFFNLNKQTHGAFFLNNQGLNSSFLKSQDSFMTNQNAWCYTTVSDAETLTVGRIKRDMKGEILLSTKQHFSSFLSRLHVRNKTYHLFIIHTSSHSCCCYWLLLPFRPPGRCLHTFCFTVTLLQAKCNHTNT